MCLLLCYEPAQLNNLALLQAQWLTLMSSNDSSFGVAASHMDVEPTQKQVQLSSLKGRCILPTSSTALI